MMQPLDVRSRHCSPIACFMVAIAAIVSIAFTSGASAQGTMGAVADPISTRDLDDYARRLGLSAQQRASLDQVHEAYKTEFAILREGEIEKFLSETAAGGAGRGMGMMMMGNIDRKAAEDALKQLESINNKINAVDARLFDHMQSMLTEDQVAQMSGVRQARERQRYRTGLSRMATFTNPSTQVDLSRMAADLTLSPDERAGVLPLLATYEMTLTSATKKLHDGANEASVKMLDRLAEMGFTADSMRDGGRRGEMWEAFRTAWEEVTSKINDRAADISELNRRSERSLAAVLATDNARRLRDEFFSRAYPEIRGSNTTARAFDVAMALEDLTDDQKAALRTIYDEFRGKWEQLTEKMADIIDAQRKSRTMLDFGRGDRGRGGGEQDEPMNKLREERQELVEAVRSQIETTIGPDMVAKLDKRVAESRDRQRAERSEATGAIVLTAPGAAGGAGGEMVVRMEGNVALELAGEIDRDPFVPAAITARDLDGYAQRLALQEEQTFILAGLHTEYMDHYKQIEDTDIKAVREAEEALRARDDSGNRAAPTPEGVDRVYALRRAALESIKQLDGAFFDDVQVALVGDDAKPVLDRVRQSRERAVYNSAAGGQGLFSVGGGGSGGGRRGGGQRMVFAGGPFGGSSEASVDLSLLAEQTNVVSTDPQQLDAALATYESAATAAFKNMFETSMRMRQSMERMAGQFTRGERGEGPAPANGDGIRQAMETDGRTSREARQTLIDLNRQTLEQLVALLDSSSAAQLRRAYNRKAFPDVFRDARSAEPRLEAALGLPDLTDPQREQLQTIAVEFHAAYDALSDQMIEIERSAPAPGERPGGRGAGAGGGFDIGALQERLRNREKLDFERNDLSDKALTRLRTTLTEEQMQRIGLEPLAGSY